MESAVKKEVFTVTGMMCAACAVSVESMIASLPGVEKASVNYSGSNVYVIYDPDVTNPEDFSKAVDSIGYGLLVGEDDLQERLEEIERKNFDALRSRLIVAVIFSIPVFTLSMFHGLHFQNMNWLLLGLSLPVIIYSGSGFYASAWKQLRHKMVNMDTLVALSTGIAFLFSIVNTLMPAIFSNAGLQPQVYYESAVVIITFILAGKFLEERSKKKASMVIRSLMQLQPKTLMVKRGGEQLDIPVAAVMPGDEVLVKHGERIPVDGLVIEGGSFVDESMINGEPLPVFKDNGTQVYAGTMCSNGSLTINALKAGNQTLLSQIIALVQEAQSSKPPIQKLADRISAIFVPVVLALAVITFLAWYFFGPQANHALAFVTTISVLIIACPCALGLATPTALITGIGRGATLGILIRNSDALQAACKVNAIVFDKTGTLTDGQPVLTKSEWITDEKLYRFVLHGLEIRSAHPLAKTIAESLETELVADIQNFEDIAGKGVRCTYESDSYLAGNFRFMTENNIDITGFENDRNLVFFSRNDRLIAVFTIEDVLRHDARNVVENLTNSGIEVHLLTGDSKEAAAKIAEQTGISHVHAEVMPADKHQYIAALKGSGKFVAMAGDGINDSAALAEADLGIALASGSDIAIESAGVVLMHGNLHTIKEVISLSKATMRTIRQNFFWAFFYNIIAIPLAAGVLYPAFGFLLTPMIAGAAMAMSSVAVVTNSLRLRKISL